MAERTSQFIEAARARSALARRPGRARLLYRPAIAAFIILAIPACTFWGGKDRERGLDRRRHKGEHNAERPRAHVPRRVGVVTLVNEEAHFVLIDGGSSSPPSPGKQLEVFRQTKPVGSVKVSAIRRRPFLIADIVQGALQAGDQVYE